MTFFEATPQGLLKHAKAMGAATLIATSVTFTSIVAQPVQAQDDPVVATVDGVEVRLSDVEAFKGLLGAQAGQVPLEQVFDPLVNRIIQNRVIAKAAREAGIEDDPAFKEGMKRVGDQLAERLHLANYIEEKLTEDRLKARYEEVVAAVSQVDERKARHILVASEEDARAAIKRLDEGADFAELAKEVSTGPSGANGGDLGFFVREQMVPEFASVAFEQEVGSYTKEPVQTQFGWHVILVEDTRKRQPPTFEQALPGLQEEMSKRIGAEYMAGLVEAAKIERFNIDGSARK